jgi:hypothetical protein
MTRRRRVQLWIPLSVVVVGSAVSVSIGLGQRNLTAFFVGEAVTVLVATVRTLISARPSDIGAVLGNRVDERQALLRLKASRVCAIVAGCGAVLACIVAAADHQTYWPYEAIYLSAAVSYLIALRAYGADREDREGREAAGASRAQLVPGRRPPSI